MRTALSCLLVALLANSVCATTWFVPSAECPTIQLGLDAASAGDTVRIAPGTYFEHDLQITAAVTVVGDTDDPGSVTIDAQSAGRGFFCDSLAGTVRVAGVTVTHGSVTGGEAPEAYGGGLLCVDTEIEVLDCRFENNIAVSGGGLCVYGSSSPSVRRCSFTFNRTESPSHGGGGAAFWYGRSATVEDSQFFGNEAYGDGGGLKWRWGGLQGGALSVVSCTFDANTAQRFGGGVEASGSTGLPKPPVEFSNCIFSSNGTSMPFSQGGALLCSYCAASLIGCVFTGNDSDRGGALYLENCETQLLQCTLAENSAAEAGGVYCWLNSDVQFTNSIVAFSSLGQAVLCLNGASASLDCCDLFGNEGGDWTGSISDQYGVNGNFAADPLFCAMFDGDVSLAGDSPCTAGSSPCGQLVGALPVGCYPAFIEDPKAISWGRLKTLFR